MLERWDGPFDEVSVQDFLETRSEGDVMQVYRTTTTARSQEVPVHLGWFKKERDGRFAAQTPRGTRISGDQLEMEEVVEALRELDPEYVVHDA